MATGFGFGPPHLYIFAAMLTSMSEMEGVLASPLVGLLKKYSEMPTNDRSDIIKLCRVVKMYKEGERKVVFSFGTTPLDVELQMASHALPPSLETWSVKVGRAPASHMERELGDWLKISLDE